MKRLFDKASKGSNATTDDTGGIPAPGRGGGANGGKGGAAGAGSWLLPGVAGLRAIGAVGPIALTTGPNLPKSKADKAKEKAEREREREAIRLAKEKEGEDLSAGDPQRDTHTII